MNSFQLLLTSGLTSMALATPSLAMQVLGDHSVQNYQSPSRLAIVTSHADIDIDAGNNGGDLEVDSIGVDYSMRYRNQIDILAQAAILYDVEADGCDGSGYSLGAGARNFITKIQKVDLYAYAMLNYASFDTDCGNVDIDGDMLSIHAGPVGAYKINEHVTVFSGTEFILFSDGSFEPEGAGSTDIELNDVVNVNIGARGNFQQFEWHAKAGLIGEQSITLSVGQSF